MAGNESRQVNIQIEKRENFRNRYNPPINPEI